MIFQHTVDKVLSGEKTQTSRIWKPSYLIGDRLHPYNQMKQLTKELTNQHIKAIWKISPAVTRKVWCIGKDYAVQPARGARGIARIKFTQMEKRSILDFSNEDIAREGFDSHYQFFQLWKTMHPHYLAVVINFKLL